MTSLPRRHTLTRLGATAAGLLLPQAYLLAQPAAAPQSLDVPYVPTPQEVVERMLQMAKVGKKDVLFDLGCGDGRIVVTAAKEHGARGTGIDLDPQRIREARKNAEQAGVGHQVSFKVADLFETDVSAASVVTLYLLPNVNTRLRPQLWKQLKVGSRVVSHAFDMGPEWPPEQTDTVEGRAIYYWTIKAAHKRALQS
ncbi:SAM-dependent methyltransferase [Massilia sp. CMS3.1]|uniref:SAM-dependent methyltransferase n=1 Tax=Massilia sp. CMS3.1 TaxID=3373083 RepID=UPI003EE47227